MEALTVQLRRHAAAWQPWWSSLSLSQKAVPGALVSFYLAALALAGDLRTDHLASSAVILAGAYGGPLPRHLLRFFLPLLLTAIVYDSMRYWAPFFNFEVHVREPYFFDKIYFGIQTASGVLTPNEWIELHTHPAIDLIAGFFYLGFIPIFLGIAGYFYFWRSRFGTPKFSAAELEQRAPQVMWAFFWVNVAGYITYQLYPAAPPWYVALHGLGPAIPDTLPNAAGCARVDELLGIPIFATMYARSEEVFGAIPSLHVAYPIQAVYFAFRFGALRKFSLFFFAMMCFSAVYLNHHYVLDVLLGSIYGVVACWATERVFHWKNKRFQAKYLT